MNVRELIVRNLGWKVLSLALGVVVYVFMRVHMEGGVFLLQQTTRENFERTVSVLTPAGLEGVFKVEPRAVRVTLIGRRDAVSRLTESDIRAYVDMTDAVTAMAVRRTVHVQPLPDIVGVEIEPGAVRVVYDPAPLPEARSNSE